jgi:hypothetical protein
MKTNIINKTKYAPSSKLPKTHGINLIAAHGRNGIYEGMFEMLNNGGHPTDLAAKNISDGIAKLERAASLVQEKLAAIEAGDTAWLPADGDTDEQALKVLRELGKDIANLITGTKAIFTAACTEVNTAPIKASVKLSANGARQAVTA